MDTIAFDFDKAMAVEKAVCAVFDCSLSEIVSLRDTLEKKVVVYVLSRYFNVDKRVVGYKYQMTYLYVPTVIVEIEFLIKTVPAFEIKIKNIYERIENILD